MRLPVDSTQSRPLPLDGALPRADLRGLYVHVPFCFHKCHYCDFYSITKQSPQRMGAFVDRILAEADGWTGGRRGPVPRPRTIFIGGGTPSLLPPGEMRRLLAGLRDRFDLAGLEEWTVECNPATVSAEYARLLRECGVDRLSFGAQSFEPGELALLERHHHPDQVARSVDIARTAGFARLNVDLIYAIPGQDLASWDRSLTAAIGLGTGHISCYNLTYEPNTPIAVKRRLGQITPVEEEMELLMLRHARRRLADAGLYPYEISNLAIPGQECLHNLLYWNGDSYLGLGPSAASHAEGWRWRNQPHLSAWEKAIDAGTLPAIDVEALSPRQRAGELAMLQLRLARGVEFDDFRQRRGIDARELFGDTIGRLAGIGLLEVDPQGFRLTDAGVNVADSVAAEFLQD